MSQFYQGTTSGSLPPSVPTSFVTDNGTVIPAANVVNVNGGSTTASNDNGIEAIANPNLSNNLEILLTNRLTGTATSTNASVESLVTFALGASVATYRVSFDVAGRDTVSGDGVGYTLWGTVKTNGAAASIISSPFIDNDEDASLLGADITLIASGNNVILTVTGVAGRTINYKAVGQYVVI